MQGDEARVLLGFPPDSRPTASQVKAAYKRKVWESHPDLFSVDKKTDAEFKFKSGHATCDWYLAKDLLCVKTGKFIAQDEIATIKEILAELNPTCSVAGCSVIADNWNNVQGARGGGLASATNTRVVRTGVPMTSGGRRNHALIGIPFLFIILGTVGLGGLNAASAYKKQKEAYPSHNPFLP